MTCIIKEKKEGRAEKEVAVAKCTETVQPLERATPVSDNFTSVWHSSYLFLSK